MLKGSIASVTAHKTALKHYSTKKSILQCLKKKTVTVDSLLFSVTLMKTNEQEYFLKSY